MKPPHGPTTIVATKLDYGPKADLIRGVDRMIKIDIFNPMKSCGKVETAITLKKGAPVE
jgi:hypothetical protein